MCGRFTLHTPTASVASLFRQLTMPQLNPSYNIAPTHQVASVRFSAEQNAPEFAKLRWGLLPGWANDIRMAARMINARSETIHEKPAFRSAFQQRRCLILADGFYEWRATPDGKEPVYITLKSDAPFCFAGLWEQNSNVDTEPLETCTIITTTANDLLAPLHERMPVILPSEKQEAWLDPKFQNSGVLRSFLTPLASDQMHFHTVSRSVNRVAYNQPDCIKPVATQGELF